MYGSHILNSFLKQEKFVINVGFIFGGIEKMISFLEIFVQEIMNVKHHWNYWGVDQAVVNYVFHSGKVDSVGVTIFTPSQLFSFEKKGKYRYDRKNKIIQMEFNDCSPVIRHKLWGNLAFVFGS